VTGCWRVAATEPAPGRRQQPSARRDERTTGGRPRQQQAKQRADDKTRRNGAPHCGHDQRGGTVRLSGITLPARRAGGAPRAASTSPSGSGSSSTGSNALRNRARNPWYCATRCARSRSVTMAASIAARIGASSSPSAYAITVSSLNFMAAPPPFHPALSAALLGRVPGGWSASRSAPP